MMTARDLNFRAPASGDFSRFAQGIEHALHDFFDHILVVYFQVFKANQNVLCSKNILNQYFSKVQKQKLRLPIRAQEFKVWFCVLSLPGWLENPKRKLSFLGG